MVVILHTISGKTFNKGQLVDYVKNNLKTLGILVGMDYEIAWYLLQRRPKIYTDRPNIKVDILQHQYGQDNCYFYDKDGQWESFSYKKAVASPFQIFKKNVFVALRDSVATDSLDFLSNNYRQPDEQVDHIIPFTQILDDFLEVENLYLSDITIMEDGEIGYSLEDRELDQRWKTYHNKVAVFQLLEASKNFSKGGSKLQRTYA